MGTAATAFFAGRIAKTLKDRGDGHVLPDSSDGIIHLVVLDLANHARHFRMNGAEPLAGSLAIANVFTKQ